MSGVDVERGGTKKGVASKGGEASLHTHPFVTEGLARVRGVGLAAGMVHHSVDYGCSGKEISAWYVTKSVAEMA